MLEFDFSSHGAGMIHAYRWEPEGQPRGVVQIIHGIAEYVPRYAGFAAFLNARGFLVTGEDHMGHGTSHGTEPCHFSGGWCAAVDDSMELLRRTQRDYPGVPYFVLGHSMGSFVVRGYLMFWPGTVDGAILSGTGQEPPATVAAGRALSALLIYGVLMNVSSALLWQSPVSWATIGAYLLSGFPVDCVHAAATVCFLWLFGEPMLEKLDRIKVKYGLLA